MLVRRLNIAVRKCLTGVSGLHILWCRGHNRCAAKVATRAAQNIDPRAVYDDRLARHRFVCAACCSSDSDTRPALWSRGVFALLPIHILPGRVVRQAEGFCLWILVGGNSGRRDCSTIDIGVGIEEVWVQSYVEGMGFASGKWLLSFL